MYMEKLFFCRKTATSATQPLYIIGSQHIARVVRVAVGSIRRGVKDTLAYRQEARIAHKTPNFVKKTASRMPFASPFPLFEATFDVTHMLTRSQAIQPSTKDAGKKPQPRDLTKHRTSPAKISDISGKDIGHLRQRYRTSSGATRLPQYKKRQTPKNTFCPSEETACQEPSRHISGTVSAMEHTKAAYKGTRQTPLASYQTHPRTNTASTT